MTIGLVCGCYSSYAIATPLYVIWKTHEPRFKKLQKKYGADVQRWFLNRLPGTAAPAAAAAGAGAGEAQATAPVAEGAASVTPAMSPHDAAVSPDFGKKKPSRAERKRKK